MTPRSHGAAAPIVLALLAVLAVALTFKPAVRDNLFPKNFGVADEGRLYRAGQLTPAAFRAVHEKYGFRTVVDFGSHGRGTRGDRRNQRIADSLGVVRYRFDLIGDATGNPNAYAQALRIMTDPEHQPVLVHCGAGSERTGCAVILYDHITRGVPIEDGLIAALDHKHDPRRNPRLREFIQQWGIAILESYSTGAPIPGVDALPPAVPISRAANP